MMSQRSDQFWTCRVGTNPPGVRGRTDGRPRARRIRLGATFVALVTASLWGPAGRAADPGDWLGFRGDGTSAAEVGPAELSLEEGGNLAWRRELSGRSVAGPVVVGPLVVSTASGGQDGEVLYVTGVDLESGEVKWEQTFRATGRPYCHPTSANAAPSPVSDGERIFAFFSSNDLICLSPEGDLLWYRGLGFDYPKAGNDVGMASSPVVAEGAVIVQVESQGDSFAAGIDARTGENLWRIERPRQANWASPVVIRRPDESTEVVLQSGRDLIAVDPRSGLVKWDLDEPRATIPSSTPAGELLLVPGNDLMALAVGRSAASPEVVWRNNRLSPRNASVVAAGDRIYSLKGSVLVCGDADSGDVHWQHRLSGVGGTWATPVVAQGRIYLFDQAGQGLVVEDRGDRAETTSEVDLEDKVLASPALVGGRLLVRGERNLFCFR